MNIIDIIILITLVLGFLLGFKRGFTKQLVSLVGIIVVLVLSFILKNPVSVFLYNNLPFFDFGGLIKGVTVLNILLYETIAFFLVFSILMIVLKLLMLLTSIFEKILTMTIILGIPSKILGGLLGIVQSIIIIFVALYIFNLPVFNFNINDSKLGKFIINKTPILSSIIDNSITVFDEFNDLKDEYKNNNNTKEFNQKALDLLIKNKIITKENAKKLVENGKLDGVVVE